MKNKKNTKRLIISIVILLILVIGIAYAAFSYAGVGQKTNVVTLGSLKLTLSEGDAVNLEDSYPLSDSQGLALNGYSFTLQNTGTADVDYAIYLDTVAISSPDVKLADSYLKYSLTKNGSASSAAYLNTLGTGTSRVLDQGTINSGANNTYILKLWTTTEIDGDIAGQVWKGKIRITGEQA